uniref:(northern house mosquito) hypothetical protein n=1 Tax=Culex pipiens TaxID=7175 RepID=A0A8D7ZVY2_CULPI
MADFLLLLFLVVVEPFYFDGKQQVPASHCFSSATLAKGGFFRALTAVALHSGPRSSNRIAHNLRITALITGTDSLFRGWLPRSDDYSSSSSSSATKRRNSTTRTN